LGDLYNLIFYQPILSALIFFYRILGNFGLAIVFLTLFIRGLLIPLTLPALRSTQKIKDLAPQLDKLKKKYKNNRQKFQQEQLKLYRAHGVNPAMGCLPYLIQFLILIALYRAFTFFIGGSGKIDGTVINTHFLWLDLTRPDLCLAILAGASQLLMSKTMPFGTQEKPIEGRKTNQKKDDLATAMEDMQKQMIYFMPLMTVVIGAKLPSGLALYWLVTSLFSAGQQYFTNGGWGKLKKLFSKNMTQKL
jgi:YidC/Oxa1 family membrane protein insertase